MSAIQLWPSTTSSKSNTSNIPIGDIHAYITANSLRSLWQIQNNRSSQALWPQVDRLPAMQTLSLGDEMNASLKQIVSEQVDKRIGELMLQKEVELCPNCNLEMQKNGRAWHCPNCNTGTLKIRRTPITRPCAPVVRRGRK